MSKILLLVEGEKTEKALLQQFYKLYGESRIEIVSYKTNIYAFYNDLKTKYDSGQNGMITYDTIDLTLLLNDHLKLKGSKRYNKNDFEEKILVFDFDPQDRDEGHEKILIELMTNFSDSIGRGKLYLNYPMVESFKDFTSLEDENFIHSTFPLSMLPKNGYKQHIHQQTLRNKLNHIKKIDKQTGRKLLELHQQKLAFVTKQLSDSKEKYLYLCKRQCEKLKDEKLIWVINTSILHLLDEYGPMP